MKIFISSVRRGLESERDALPGLILALGHEPVRFEDFAAQAVPSREACLRGVAASDSYLLLLGPHYGHVFPETGQSATHDEWMAAVAAGMPRIVFRKSDVTFEPEQEAFSKEVGDYGTGVFYGTFTSAVDLQAKVAQAIRSLEQQPGTLSYGALVGPDPLVWRDEWAGAQRPVDDSPYLELHVAPIGAERRSARLMRELPERVVAGMRSAGALPLTAGAAPAVDADAVTVELPIAEQRRWNEPHGGGLRGVRVAAAGQVSLWWSLPGDGMGAILDAQWLRDTISQGLRLIGALRLLDGDQLAVGAGIGGSTSRVSEGQVTGTARSSASFGFGSSDAVRVPPDETVSTAALDRGADEVANTTVESLLEAFRRRR